MSSTHSRARYRDQRGISLTICVTWREPLDTLQPCQVRSVTNRPNHNQTQKDSGMDRAPLNPPWNKSKPCLLPKRRKRRSLQELERRGNSNLKVFTQGTSNWSLSLSPRAQSLKHRSILSVRKRKKLPIKLGQLSRRASRLLSRKASHH